LGASNQQPLDGVAETYVHVGCVRAARVAQNYADRQQAVQGTTGLRNAMSSLAVGARFERSELIAFVF
jgi:hypothetical protein